MTKARYAVIKTGRRTWQIAEFSTLDAMGGTVTPMFDLRSDRFHSEFEALTQSKAFEADYQKADTKVLHDLAFEPMECTPRRFRTLAETLAA